MHLAEKITYCSSCFRQDIELRHVDCEAYWDGPVIDGVNHKQPIDDLILCEKCIKEAGELVGIYPADELKKENEELGKTVESYDEQIRERDELISDLTNTVQKLTGDKIQKPSRRPRILA